METNEILSLYLSLFLVAWKKAYKLGWIYHKMVEAKGKEAVLAFYAAAEEKGYPLVPEACHAYASTTYFLTTVNRGFSDWMYRVNPDAEKFVKNVLANSQRLGASRVDWKESRRECAEELRQRGWEALDSFGGQTKGLRKEQLVYRTLGRTTGKGMSEKTFAGPRGPAQVKGDPPRVIGVEEE